MLTDPIADFLTRLRNASHARRNALNTRSSKLIKAIAQVLKNKRFIGDFEENDAQELTITLIPGRDPLEIKRVSKPGQRIYVALNEVRKVRNGHGVGVISTSRGILTDEEARAQKVGGEYICEIY